jgi:hypothetical protein
MSTLTIKHIDTILAALKRYQAAKAERQLAEQRIQAAFGDDAKALPTDTKIINQPAIAVAAE